MVGALRYLCNTRPDIAFCVGVISRVMDRPRVSHLMAAKRIMRYLKGTMSYGILFPSKSSENMKELYGYTDADWCGGKNDRKSIADFVFFAGTTLVSWCSKKEVVVALSSSEAEYIASAMGACQVVWLDTLMLELKMKKENAVELFVDNKSEINLAKFPVAHVRCKHIETRYHFLRDQVTKGKLKLSYCRSEDQCADIFTKSLKKDNFKKMRNNLNMIDCRKLD
ncbi:secreted RxLR effector protein 161-like [Medicago truncatula]|uniref:secreted RxLR effector protein 161-like n=1 Tax=Medicago truncatula TaxID=3880 RepID=UPI0019679053|nr:secreted RxLR effector protein 161-like [Medicago truncatula]